MAVATLTVLRLLLFVFWTLICLPVYLPLLVLRWGYRPFALFYWKVVANFVLRMTVVVRGGLSSERPLMCVANHASYLDIVVFGGLIPGCFVAKREVRGWAGIGFLARIARTVFVDRRPSSVGHQREELAERLREGEPLILFPEGTSSDGNRVLAFKSPLFSVAEMRSNGHAVHVQPISIAYTRQNGLPMGRVMRATYSWFGDMDLVTHLWEAMNAGRFTVEVDFLPTVTLAQFENRKLLAKYCEMAIRRAFGGALNGRPVLPAEVGPSAFAIPTVPAEAETVLAD